MMNSGSITIDRKTSIKTLLDFNEEKVIAALEKLNRNFRRLRNPTLRKLLAKRVSISDACRIANCNEEEFLSTMKEIGFSINTEDCTEQEAENEVFQIFQPENVIEFDVRPIIAANQDPLKQIMQQVNKLNAGESLKLINTFEPLPLISLLAKKGYKSYTERPEQDLVITYFKKQCQEELKEVQPAAKPVLPSFISFDSELAKYHGKLKEIDVTALEMPGPMVKILESVETLNADEALFVHHKKVPVYLLPHLHEKGFQYLIQEEENGKVSLLIHR